MEDNFTQNEFEEFLRDQVKNHRMYPKDAVWRRINNKLHGDKKWPALTVAALLIFSASVIIGIYFPPKASLFAVNPSIEPVSAPVTSKPAVNALNKLTSSAAFSKQDGGVTTPSSAGNGLTDPLANKDLKTVVNNSATETKDLSKYISAVVEKKTPATIKSKISIAGKDLVTQKVSNPVSAAITKATEADIYSSPNALIENKNRDNTSDIKTLTAGEPTAGDRKNLERFSKEKNVEFALRSNRGSSKRNRFSFQMYAAPSISYRKLFEDRTLLKTGSAGPVGLNYVTDVNNVVRHKPGTGIEAGISFMYQLSDKVRIKSGLQFNVRQYSIEAYRSNTEVASIALIGRNGTDTINRLARYRNNNGYYSAELVNRYYQVALPIGVEWEVLGNKTIQLNVAASIQPTYLFNRNAYLLSTNFKNYTESPEMVRSWNINSNIETFISIKSGDFKWQIGPQVRYQPYSTFITEYPIKEHLLDYGLKVGVSKTIGKK